MREGIAERTRVEGSGSEKRISQFGSKETRVRLDVCHRLYYNALSYFFFFFSYYFYIFICELILFLSLLLLFCACAFVRVRVRAIGNDRGASFFERGQVVREVEVHLREVRCIHVDWCLL